MNLAALLSWYDERPADLEQTITSLALAGVDTLVAIDGAYDRFPGGTPRSPADNYQAIQHAANTTGIQAHIRTPDYTWPTEMDKRTALFRMGEQHTTEQDWYLIIDADEQITQAPHDLHHQLTSTPLNVGEVILDEDRGRTGRVQYPIPILFRAIRGLHVTHNHFTYRTPDGRNLWGNAVTTRLEPRLQLHNLTLNHNTLHRHPDRRARSLAYYQHRDRDHIENPYPRIPPTPPAIAA